MSFIGQCPVRAKVVPIRSGSETLKDAVNEATSDRVADVEAIHYVIGSTIGPPTIMRQLSDMKRKFRYKCFVSI